MSDVTTSGWPLGDPPRSYVLGHVRAVLADRLLDDARIVVEDGLIAAVEEHPSSGGSDLDGNGLLCIPGLIDVHSDALERERMPRPGAHVPLEFAFTSFESKLRAAGITTVFHGAAFQNQSSDTVERTVDAATELAARIDAVHSARVDHRVLHRLDIRSAEGAAALTARLDAVAAAGGIALVSHEDHTPGQGQYTDRSHLEAWMIGQEGKTPAEARAEVDALIDAAEGTRELSQQNLAWLGERARAGTVRLLGHDPDTAEVVDSLLARGGSTAEFPTTVEAAERARELGLLITIGAPNVLRGASHNGNVSGRDLVARGLADALASDYLPSALLGAAFVIAGSGATSLPGAIALVSSGPASVAGLDDRGRLEPGLRADLALVDDREEWPHTVATFSAGTATRRL